MRAHTITTKPPVGGKGRTRRTSAHRGVLALGLAVALLAATASTAGAGRGPYLSEAGPSVASGAGAAIFKGRTEQGRRVTVRVGDDGLVNSVYIADRVRCQPPQQTVFPNKFGGAETYRAPLDESTPTSFADKNKRTEPDGSKRLRVKFEVTGEKISDTKWTGTARRKIIATRHGRVIGLCKTGELDWSATLVS